jgi:hypothetical protein
MAIGLLWKWKVLSIFVKSKDQVLIFKKRYPAGILWGKKTDAEFLCCHWWELYGNLGLHWLLHQGPFFCKAPVLGFHPTPYFLPQILTSLWEERERSSKENNQQ